MDRRQRMTLLGIAAAIAAAVGVIALVSGGGDDGGESTSTAATEPRPSTQAGGDTTTAVTKPAKPAPTIVKLQAEGGRPVGGVEKVDVKKNETVELRATADAAEILHLHGYDIEKPVVPGRTTKIRFKAKIEGVFEAELENSHTKLLEITVEP